MCNAFVITQSVSHRQRHENKNERMIQPRGATERGAATIEKTQWFFRFLFFSCDLFVASAFFSIRLLSVFLFSVHEKKPQMNWCGEIVDSLPLCFLRSSHFQIIFYCFCNFVFMPFYSWFSRVCLNHSLLTYKVCLNKHVPRFYSLSPSVGEGCVSMHVCVFSFPISAYSCAILCFMLQLTVSRLQTNHFPNRDRHSQPR